MSAKSPDSVLTQMMKKADFSDLKFICNGHEFNVHKPVVCIQSPVIKAAIQGGFEESDTNAITMNNFQPNTVRRMIQFMYTGDYDEHEDEHEPSIRNACLGDSDEIKEVGLLGDQLQFGGSEDNSMKTASKAPAASSSLELSVSASLFEHINVNSIGDYYDIADLVSLANVKIKQLLCGDSEDQSWVASLPSAIDMAFRLTGDDELLEILASATAANISSLLGSDRFTSLGILTDFSIKVLHKCAQEVRVSAGQREESKLKLREAGEKEQLSKREISRLRGCLQVLKETSQCRNSTCGAEFACLIDPSECILRCAKCRCKHYS